MFEVFKVKIAKHRKWTPSDLVLQSDKGSEFKGALQERFRKLRVKLVYSGPRLQENRSHCAHVRAVRSVRCKMEYDSLKLAGRKVLIRRKDWPKTRGF